MPDISIACLAVMALTVVAWLTVIPLAGATISRAITVERIFSPVRDFIEVRWPRSLLHYISTCPVCMSYWTTSACSVAGWWIIGGPTSPPGLAAAALLTLAAIRPANIFASYGESPN